MKVRKEKKVWKLATFSEAVKCNAPINVNPVGRGGGGMRARGGDLTNLKIFDQIPQGGKRKVNQKCQKAPTPGKKCKQTIL